MVLAEAVSLSGEVMLLVLLVVLIAFLASVSVVVGTVVAARRHARTGSAASAVVAAIGVTAELYVFAIGAVQSAPLTMALAGGAVSMAVVAYAMAKRTPRAT